MNRLTELTIEKAPDQSKKLFEEIKKSIGMLPNIYKVIGNSPNALAAYLSFSESQKYGSFNSKEREAVYLAVSEENGCNYCLSAHTEIAIKNGFNEEETLQLRAGTHNSRRISIIINLAKSIIINRGKADENLINAFYEAGYNSQALVDLVALVVEQTFTNYIGRLSKPEIDFPRAKTLNLEILV